MDKKLIFTQSIMPVIFIIFVIAAGYSSTAFTLLLFANYVFTAIWLLCGALACFTIYKILQNVSGIQK